MLDIDIININIRRLEIIVRQSPLNKITLENVLVGKDFSRYYFYGDNYQVELLPGAIRMLMYECQKTMKFIEIPLEKLGDVE